MFKLVIVEDEDNIRHSLECFIPWNAIGFQVVGTFSDGSDALDYLKEHPCDAVLTDILMSRMSGLELIRNLYDIAPQIKVVILSGHSDFAYAQQAIRYQVVHYLVKPVDEEELISVFKTLKEQLEDRKEETAETDQENRELKHLLQKGFFRDLLSGRISSRQELDTYRKLLGLNQLQMDSCLLAYELALQAFQEQEDGQVNALEAVLQELSDGTGGMYHVFPMEERHDLWCIAFVGLPGVNLERLQACCDRQMQSLCNALHTATAETPAFRLTHSAAQLAQLFPNVTDGLALQEKPDRHELCQRIIAPYKLLILELDMGSKETLMHLLEQTLRDLNGISLEDARFVLKNLYAVIELDYQKRKIKISDITNGKFDANRLYRVSDVRTLGEYAKDAFCALCDGLKQRKYRSEHAVVGHLLDYLREHMDEDIGHEEIAKKYRVHPGYLSRLFKQEMGETLSEYLLRIRIEKAARLLKEGQYKIGDVAGMVGYNTSSYFSIMFKKYTGYSPREYSQRISLQ